RHDVWRPRRGGWVDQRPEGDGGPRTIRAKLVDADAIALLTLPGVEWADRHGNTVILRCSDADAALRALLDRFPATRAIEVTGAGLEQAFLELTASNGGRPAPAEFVRSKARAGG